MEDISEVSLEWYCVLRIGMENTSLTKRRKAIFTESRFERRVDPQIGRASTHPRFAKSQRLHARLGHPGRIRLSGFEKIIIVYNNVLSKRKIERTSAEHQKGVKTHNLILPWWVRNCSTILAISVPSEAIFSVEGEILTKRRSALAIKKQ
jgi:hypothetical protein